MFKSVQKQLVRDYNSTVASLDMRLLPVLQHVVSCSGSKSYNNAPVPKKNMCIPGMFVVWFVFSPKQVYLWGSILDKETGHADGRRAWLGAILSLCVWSNVS